jgi:hypothetical protein
MPDWQKDLIELWESVVSIVDEIGSGFQELVEELAETVALDLEAIGNELQSFQEEWWPEADDAAEADSFDEDPTETLDGGDLFDFSSMSDEDWPMYYEPRQEASADFHPACMGCRNYNGTNFGGNLLICGFHPYGWAEDSCPDWEAQ